jgi:tetratricopeptide (TPR) repeat protein
MNRRRVLYGLLVSIYVVSEAIAFSQSKGVAWALQLPSGLGEIGALAIALLLFILIFHAEEHNSKLIRVLEDAAKATVQLDGQLRLVEATNTDTRQLRVELDTLRTQVRSSDVLLHGRMLFAQQKYSQAANLFEDSVRETPTDPSANYWLGLATLRAGEPAKAIQYLRTAAKGGADGEILHALGEAESKARRPDDAIEHFEQALAVGVKNQEEVHIRLAEIYRQRDPTKAKELLMKVIAANPYNGNTYVALAEIARDEGNTEEALRLCNLAVEKNPKNWGVLACRAETLLSRRAPGDLDLAKKDLDSVRLANPRDFNLYRIEGRLYTEQGLELSLGEEREALLAKALSIYAEGIKNLPANFRAPFHTSQSYLYLILNRPTDAEKAAELAVASYGNHINNHLALLGSLAACSKWSALQRAARKARDVGGRAGSIFSLLYEILGALCAGDALGDLSEETAQLLTELRAMPSFSPTRWDWPYVRSAVEARARTLTGSAQTAVDAAAQFLSQEKSITEFVAILQALTLPPSLSEQTP